MANDLFTLHLNCLWKYIQTSWLDPNKTDEIVSACMASPDLDFGGTYKLYTSDAIKKRMRSDPNFHEEILYAYFIMNIDVIFRFFSYDSVNLEVEKEYLDKLLAKRKGKLLWSQQIQCRYSASSFIEPIYLPAMYLSKIKLLDSKIEFTDEAGKPIKLCDITLDNLSALNALDTINTPKDKTNQEDKNNRASVINTYFKDLLRESSSDSSEGHPLPFDNSVESNYSRQLYDDLRALAEYIPAFKGTKGNLTNTNLYETIMNNSDLAKFYYIYKKYFIWKYQHENNPRSMSIDHIGSVTYTEKGQQTQRRGVANRSPYNSLHFNNLDPNNRSPKNMTAALDDISLGNLTGFSSGNGKYTDELYTLLMVNGNIKTENLISLGFIWRSHLWGESCHIKALTQIPLMDKCRYFVSERLSRTYELFSLIRLHKLYAAKPDIFGRCLTHLFFYHVNKHSRLIHTIRAEILESLDVDKTPDTKTIQSLINEINCSPDAFIRLFYPVIKKEKNKQPWLSRLTLNYNRKADIPESARSALVRFIYGDNPTKQQQTTMEDNIKFVSPFLCLYPDNKEVNHAIKANWIYSACIGLYFMCIIIPSLNKKLNLKRQTLNPYMKNSNMSKKSIKTLLRTTHLGRSSSYYHIIKGISIPKSSYTVISLNPFSALINIENYNSAMEMTAPLIGYSEKESDLALVRSIIIFEIVLLFIDLYAGRTPSWAIAEGLSDLKKLEEKNVEGDSYAFKDIQSFL